MEYDNLMTSMEASADERIAELVAKANESARKARDEAQKKAGDIVKAHVDDAAHAMEVERNRAMFEARAAAKKEAAGLKHEYYVRAFDAAEKRLASLREQDSYPVFFERALAESIAALGEKELVLHIDGRDAPLCRKAMGSLGIDCAVVADVTTAGGLNASTTDGRVVVYNTVEARLKSARERMRLELFSRLFGD